jgi:hypothetical protein
LLWHLETIDVIGETMRPAKNVLLTGAGFTKDFGGYLGDEMWAAILSQKEISTHPKLRQILLSRQNYELVHHTVLESDSYSAEEKSAFKTAVETAYKHMHQNVMAGGTHVMFQHSSKSLIRGIVLRFAGTGEERGFIFTLNQDLFLEGFFNDVDPDYAGYHLSTPGTTPPRGGFLGSLQQSLKDSD